ncbi:MAG: hypothetical protein PHX30_06140 [Candidatus Pacebacteria bacterium]|nr:hypothetical protein [Candidatus Paceibacterota bacterium]
MIDLNVDIREQKEYECLPACLRAVFSFFKIEISEEEIIDKISKDSSKLYDWEFKAGKLAKEKGLNAEIYTNVSQIFDPSWMGLSANELIEKIKKELEFFVYRNDNFEKDPELMSFMCPNKIVAERLIEDAKATLAYLESGGIINFNPISKDLIDKKLSDNIPVIISHNPTLLHRLERFSEGKSDDIKGESWGHVVIISGETNDNFIISDPAGIFYEEKMTYEADKDLILESILRYNGQILVFNK